MGSREMKHELWHVGFKACDDGIRLISAVRHGQLPFPSGKISPRVASFFLADENGLIDPEQISTIQELSEFAAMNDDIACLTMHGDTFWCLVDINGCSQ